jgi:hypothetical protein
MAQSRLTAPLRILLAAVLGLALASPARAALITLTFEGDVNLSAHGGATSNPFSGFFTWNSDSTPFDSGSDFAFYDVIAYQMIFNGTDYTRPIIGSGTGNGLAVFNDAFEPGVGDIDALVFFASLDNAAPSGNDLLFLGALADPTHTVFNSTALPSSTAFLASMTVRLSQWTDEVPGGGEADDIPLGDGTFTITGVRVVPEPATLVLTAFGLAGALARARRARR